MAANMFKYVERCLYEFQENRARMEKIRETLWILYNSSTAHAQALEETQHNGDPGDPVAARGVKIITLEDELKRLSERVAPIERVLAALDVPFLLEGTYLAPMGRLIRLWYFAKIPRDKIANLLGMSRITVYRLRRKAVELVAKHMRG